MPAAGVRSRSADRSGASQGSRGLPFERCELMVRNRWRRPHQQHGAGGEAEVARFIQSDSSSHPLPNAPTSGKAAWRNIDIVIAALPNSTMDN